MKPARFLAAAVSWLGLVAALPAHAQGVVAYTNNGSGCSTFSSFSFDWASGVLSVACADTAAMCRANGPGTFTIEGLGATRPTTGVSTSRKVRIVRTGGCAGNYTVAYAAGVAGLNGWSFNGAAANGRVQFLDGQTAVEVDFFAGVAPGAFVVMLVRSDPIAGTTQPATVDGRDYWIDVGARPELNLACTTTATRTISPASTVRNDLKVRDGESVAVVFTPTSPSYVTTYETVFSSASASHRVSISACPGHFDVPCSVTASYVGVTLRLALTGTSTLADCKLPPGQTFYANFRFEPGTCTASEGCQQALSLALSPP